MHLISFVRGALFGGFIMYLFAPRSGAETRRLLTQKTDNLKSVLEDTISDVTRSSESEPVTLPRKVTLPASGNIYDPATLNQLQ